MKGPSFNSYLPKKAWTGDVEAGKSTTVDFTFAPGQKAAVTMPLRELSIPADGKLVSILTN